MADTIEHQADRQRFVLTTDHGEAELTYRQRDRTIVFLHTGVPPAMQHQGFADRLAEAALLYARAQGLRVEARCRFVAVYLKRHKEYDDLLVSPAAP